MARRLPPAALAPAPRFRGPSGRFAPLATVPIGSTLPRNRPGATAIDRALAGMDTEDSQPDPVWLAVSSKWVAAARVWPAGVYRTAGLVSEPYLDLRFKDGHEHRYQVNANVLRAFLAAGSKGKFVHRVLLGPGWTPKNRQSRYPNWPL